MFCYSLYTDNWYHMQMFSIASYKLSVKLNDFTVWLHTWWKNWENCTVLTDNSVFHTQNCAVHSGNPTVSSVYLPTLWWLHLKALNRTDKPDRKPVLCQRTFSSVFRAVCTQLNCTVYSVWRTKSIQPTGRPAILLTSHKHSQLHSLCGSHGSQTAPRHAQYQNGTHSHVTRHTWLQ
jgi:hypothetical protein